MLVALTASHLVVMLANPLVALLDSPSAALMAVMMVVLKVENSAACSDHDLVAWLGDTSAVYSVAMMVASLDVMKVELTASSTEVMLVVEAP